MIVKFLAYCDLCINWFSIEKRPPLFKKNENCIYCGSKLKLRDWNEND